jgi:hypothetical protein
MVRKASWRASVPGAKTRPRVYVWEDVRGCSIEGTSAVGCIGWCRVEEGRVARRIEVYDW